ncbi:MAG: histidine phosphotransferase family protein [Alphaproteobacteria bacterium]
MRELDIAALMCSKVCHDLISPVGALANGLEVLSDDDDTEMRNEALALIDTSARAATAKLQFARLAFGASQSAGENVEMSMAEGLARGVFETGKTALDWGFPAGPASKDRVRLMLNILVLANDAIPRGGKLRVAPSEDGGPGGVDVTATGERASVPEGFRFFETPVDSDGADLDARSIQAFMAHLLARRLEARIDAEAREDSIVFRIRYADA